jgi:hypothetical protein
MFQSERAQGVVLKRIARRVEDILQAARDRERRGQHLALEIDAKFRLQDMGAVQFQLASAILEEAGGLEQEEVVSELLSLGLAAVLDGAARAASNPADNSSGHGRESSGEKPRAPAFELPRPAGVFGSRMVN